MVQLADVDAVLKSHEYMWLRKGPIARSGDVIGWGWMPGPRPNQQIWLNNFGLPDRPNLRAMVYEDGKRIFENWHFKTPQDGYSRTWEACLKEDRRPSLRLFEWYPGHFAHAVDGLIDTQVIIVEAIPGSGEWRMQQRLMKTGRIFWLDAVWSSPEDALRFQDAILPLPFCERP